MLFNSYTSVSHLINTGPSELLRLRLSEQIASESACAFIREFTLLLDFWLEHGYPMPKELDRVIWTSESSEQNHSVM